MTVARPSSRIARLVSSRFVLRFLWLSTATFLVSGCTTLNLKLPWERDESPDYALIGDNLVNAMSQLPHLNPLLATVQVSKPETGFDAAVQQELAERGYKLEPFGFSDSVNVVRSQIRKATDENAQAGALYVLNVGKVSVERSYELLAEKTVPVSELVIRGSQERAIQLNDDLFEVPNSPFSKVAFKEYDGPGIAEVLKPEPDATRRSAFSFWRSKKDAPVKQNVYLTMKSNYQEVFGEYDEIDRQILIFPNDSLIMGDDNKQVIQDFVAKMDQDTDVLSVIGCSHGNTDINNGNSLLALGRANRVKEAFMFSGVSHDKVLEEGCWAPTTFDEVMPQRGVVLTLKRRKDAS